MALNPRRRQDPEGRYEERVDGITLEDAATFVASATPIIGDAMAAKEVYDELQKDDPNYYLAGALGGAAVIGLVPGLGDAAANAIRAGARKAIDVGKRIEVDPNTVGSLGGNIKLKPPVEETTPQVSNIDYQKKMAEFDTNETADDWQTTVGNYVTESRDVSPTIRTPDLEASAKDLLDGKITREQHLENIDKYKPVEAWDALPREPSSKATVFSLNKKQRKDGKFILPDKAVKNLNVEKSSLKVGDKFNGRLDIPAYNAFDTWIVAGTSTAEKGVTHYAKAIHYKGVDDKPVRFLASQGKGEKIGMGKADPAYTKDTHEKTGYATVSGEIKDLDVEEIRDKAAKFLEDPEWTQVGFDPRRQGGFYVRSGENKHVPIREADEVIQIGPLVLAKNAKLDMEHTGYNEGGVVDSMDKEMNDMLLEEQVDPVSGNTAPVGALPSEVRDDITVNVSPNEFVIPAYTLRYFGEDFFNELLGASEQGWDRIKAGEEPMPPKSEADTEALKEGYDEGGAIPGEDVDVPPPVGGGYGQYGGTGATFGGFEFKIFINPETEQEIRIYFFNGKPLSRIPEGFREKGVTAVEEQKQVTEEQARDDGDDDKAVPEAEKNWRSTAVRDWTNTDYKDYNEDLASKIRNGEDPLGISIVEKGILSVVGGLIAGPAGSIALPMLAKKAKERQAEAAHTQAINLMQSSSDRDIISTADATRYITGSALNKSGYAVSVADPFSGDYKSDDDRNIFDRVFGIQGDLDPVTGMPTAEAVRQRNIDQYGSETSNYMLDPYRPPSREVGETIAGTSSTTTSSKDDDRTSSLAPTTSTVRPTARPSDTTTSSKDDDYSAADMMKDIQEQNKKDFTTEAGKEAAMTGWKE